MAISQAVILCKRLVRKGLSRISGLAARLSPAGRAEPPLSPEEWARLRALTASIRKARRAHPEQVFLVLTPVHDNLGDHAIALAEQALLQSAGLSFYELPGLDLFFLERCGRLSVMNGAPILFNGGGYLGTLWYHDERVVRSTLLANPKSHILLFPNTVFYEASPFGKAEWEKAKEIYGGHRHLKLYAREQYSLETLRQLKPNAALAPDVVFTLKKDGAALPRRGVSVCLRGDQEKTLTAADAEKIAAFTGKCFSQTREISTITPYGVPVERREAELSELFRKFEASELVITDRLHGMIFSAITGTPCIVLDSKSPKVRGCYEWIRHLSYIVFCDDLSRLEEIYRDMPHGGQTYEQGRLLPLYEELRRDLGSIRRRKWPK